MGLGSGLGLALGLGLGSGLGLGLGSGLGAGSGFGCGSRPRKTASHGPVQVRVLLTMRYWYCWWSPMWETRPVYGRPAKAQVCRWPRLEAALRLVWRWRGVSELEGELAEASLWAAVFHIAEGAASVRGRGVPEAAAHAVDEARRLLGAERADLVGVRVRVGVRGVG